MSGATHRKATAAIQLLRLWKDFRFHKFFQSFGGMRPAQSPTSGSSLMKLCGSHIHNSFRSGILPKSTFQISSSAFPTSTSSAMTSGLPFDRSSPYTIEFDLAIEYFPQSYERQIVSRLPPLPSPVSSRCRPLSGSDRSD